jgi:hypothetical protein
MRKLQRVFIFIFAAFVHVACSRSGKGGWHSLDQAEVEKNIHVGMSRNEVIAKFGKPLQELPNNDGSVRMIYLDSSFASPGAKPLHYTGFQLILRNEKVISYLPVQGRSY